MSDHRFFVNPKQIRRDTVVLSGAQARQIHSVLRLAVGDMIRILDNRGWEYEVELSQLSARQVTGQVVEKNPAAGETSIQLTLYQSLLKRDGFEWILQKGTELGIHTFVPIITQRTVVRQQVLKPNKLTRWQRIIGEAAEQCARGRIPHLSQPLSFDDALKSAQGHDLALIPYEMEKETGVSAAVADATQQSSSAPPRSVAVLIGPEGGFSAEEIEQALQAGILPVTLGVRTLRSETAAVVATTLVLHELGELQGKGSGKEREPAADLIKRDDLLLTNDGD